MTDELLEGATHALHGVIPLMRQMGVRVVDLAPGRVATEVPFEGNGNHVGTMYAGVLFSVAEVLGGLICAVTFDGERYAPVVKAAQIRFLRPATTAVRATASLDDDTVRRLRDEADARGKAAFPLLVRVTDAEGTVVAELEGDYQLRLRDQVA